MRDDGVHFLLGKHVFPLGIVELFLFGRMCILPNMLEKSSIDRASAGGAFGPGFQNQLRQ